MSFAGYLLIQKATTSPGNDDTYYDTIRIT